MYVTPWWGCIAGPSACSELGLHPGAAQMLSNEWVLPFFGQAVAVNESSSGNPCCVKQDGGLSQVHEALSH